MIGGTAIRPSIVPIPLGRWQLTQAAVEPVEDPSASRPPVSGFPEESIPWRYNISPGVGFPGFAHPNEVSMSRLSTTIDALIYNVSLGSLEA